MQITVRPFDGTQVLMEVDGNDIIGAISDHLYVATGRYYEGPFILDGKLLAFAETFAQDGIADGAVIWVLPGAGAVPYAATGITPGPTSGSRLVALASGRMVTQTVSGVEEATSYLLACSLAGSLTGTVRFRDADGTEVGQTSVPVGVSGETTVLAECSITTVAPATATSAEIVFTAGTAGVLIDDVSFTAT